MNKMIGSVICLSLIAVSAWAGEPCCETPLPDKGGKGDVVACDTAGDKMVCPSEKVAPAKCPMGKRKAGTCDRMTKPEMKCEGGKCMVASPEAAKAAPRRDGTISVEGLAALIRAKVPVLILDARPGKIDDEQRIPGAKSLSAASTAEEVNAAIPDKSALIVTYCAGLKCPASHLLAERLHKDGFQNVVELPEGIAGWLAAKNVMVENQP